MRSVISSGLAVLAAAAIMSAPTALNGASAAAPASAAVQAASDTAKFAGTYTLITTEQKDASGKWVQTPNFNSNGYIIYAPTGQMAVHIQPKIRERMPNPPTGDAAKAAITGYTAYFGTYTVDEKDHSVTHHRVGQINPGGAVDAKRYYDFTMTPQGRERLTLTPAPANGGGKDKATTRLVWQRMPDAPLSAEAKKFVGFWRLRYTDSYRTKDGKEVFHGDRNETRAGTSYIIYTNSGHMMVHLMNREGRTKYAGAQPTPEEALKAYRSYTGYFGRFVTYENQNPPFVYHSQQGSLTPGSYSEQKRFYQFTGNMLRLGGPPNLNDKGELAGGHLYWEKQGPIN
jgi:hypothetical protein